MVIENRGALSIRASRLDRSGMRDWLEGDKVNSVLQGRLARGIENRGFAPETPVKGESPLTNPASQSERIATD